MEFPPSAKHTTPPRFKIAVLRALPLADLLCAVPLLRALDAAYPDALIVLAGLPQAREFAGRFRRYVDAFVEFPGFPGVPHAGTHGDLPGFYALMQDQRLDLAIQLHDDGRLTNPLTVLMGARQNAGFYVPGRYCPDPLRFAEWRAHEPDIERCLRLLEQLRIPSKGAHLEVPLTEADWEDWRTLGLGRYVCIECGAQDESTPWTAASFAAVGDALAMQGWPVVLRGSVHDAPFMREVARAMHEPPVCLAGDMTLGQLGALAGRARLVIAADPALLRIAAAMRTPSIERRASPDEVIRQIAETFARAA
jgi:ADP-heptose:LPS heptosyltransferase